MRRRHRLTPKPLLNPNPGIPIRHNSSQTIAVAVHIEYTVILDSVTGVIGTGEGTAAVASKEGGGAVGACCGCEGGDGEGWGDGTGGVPGVGYWRVLREGLGE